MHTCNTCIYRELKIKGLRHGFNEQKMILKAGFCVVRLISIRDQSGTEKKSFSHTLSKFEDL